MILDSFKYYRNKNAVYLGTAFISQFSVWLKQQWLHSVVSQIIIIGLIGSFCQHHAFLFLFDIHSMLYNIYRYIYEEHSTWLQNIDENTDKNRQYFPISSSPKKCCFQQRNWMKVVDPLTGGGTVFDGYITRPPRGHSMHISYSRKMITSMTGAYISKK